MSNSSTCPTIRPMPHRAFSALKTALAIGCLLGTSLSLQACTDAKAEREAARVAAITAQIEDVRSVRARLDRSVTTKRANLESMERDLASARRSLNDWNREAERFVSDHKMAVAPIAGLVEGGRIYFDSSNRFSKDAQDLAGWMGVAALAWALFHMDEVAMVVDALNQADTAISGL